jgi:hypothetical protein
MLVISFRHIILLAIILIPILVAVGYAIYRVVKYAMKKAIIESRQNNNQH